MGVAMLLNRDLFPAMVGQIAQNYGLIFLSGILSLLAGVAIVRVHNVWTGGWRVIVTVLGWLAIVGGLAAHVVPADGRAGRRDASEAIRQALIVGGLVVLALGAFLSYKSYMSDT